MFDQCLGSRRGGTAFTPYALFRINSMRPASICILFGWFLLIGCSEPRERIVHQLDAEYGFQGLVLGDSLFGEFVSQVVESSSNYEVIERHVFDAAVIPPRQFESIDHRFVHGFLMEEIYAGAINGSIYFYALTNPQADSSSQRGLLDSLVAH